MERGRFITFEGGEGAGKSTQVRLLAEALEAAGLSVLTTREPGGSVGAEAIRELLLHGPVEGWSPFTEALLHFAARREHLEKTVWPALGAGSWVVSDRFADSTMAYQGYGQGLGAKTVQRLYDEVVGEFTPDLTIILDLPVPDGLARADGRQAGRDRYERMDIEFHERLRRGFLEIAERDAARCRVVDARPAPDEVHAKVQEIVMAQFELGVPGV